MAVIKKSDILNMRDMESLIPFRFHQEIIPSDNVPEGVFYVGESSNILEIMWNGQIKRIRQPLNFKCEYCGMSKSKSKCDCCGASS